MCSVPAKEENSDFQGPPSALEVWYVKVGVLNKLQYCAPQSQNDSSFNLINKRHGSQTLEQTIWL